MRARWVFAAQGHSHRTPFIGTDTQALSRGPCAWASKDSQSDSQKAGYFLPVRLRGGGVAFALVLMVSHQWNRTSGTTLMVWGYSYVTIKQRGGEW